MPIAYPRALGRGNTFGLGTGGGTIKLQMPKAVRIRIHRVTAWLPPFPAAAWVCALGKLPIGLSDSKSRPVKFSRTLTNVTKVIDAAIVEYERNKSARLNDHTCPDSPSEAAVGFSRKTMSTATNGTVYPPLPSGGFDSSRVCHLAQGRMQNFLRTRAFLR